MPISISGSGTITGISVGGLPNACVNEATLTTSAISFLAPPGAVSYVLQSTAPSGWLKANGAAISRTTYSALFAAIGTTFGAGDGSTTFNLPDLRGQFVRAWADDGTTYDSGRVFGSTQADDFKSHAHRWGTDDNLGAGGGSNPDANGGTNWKAYTEATGGTETRPRNIALLAIVKY